MKREELDDYYYYEDTVMTPANHLHRVYHADEVDRLLDEKDAEIEALNRKYERMRGKHMAEMVGSGMRERRLRRALYKACANWADVEVFDRTVGIDDPNIEANRWALMRNKCLKKSEEYK